MFAFGIWDNRKRRLFLARDRVGIKPLYYFIDDNKIIFASEIKALWQLPWLNKKIKQESIYDYLTFMVTPAPKTIFENIYKLEAGSYISIDSNKKVEIRNWYSPTLNVSS